MKKHFIYIGILLGLGVALYILLKPVNDFIEFHGKKLRTLAKGNSTQYPKLIRLVRILKIKPFLLKLVKL